LGERKRPQVSVVSEVRKVEKKGLLIQNRAKGGLFSLDRKNMEKKRSG